MRAHGTQIKCFRVQFFVYEPDIASNVDTGIPIVRMMQFVVVEQGITFVHGQKTKSLPHFVLQRQWKFLVLTLEHAVINRAHELRIKSNTHFLEAVVNLHFALRKIFFALIENASKVWCRVVFSGGERDLFALYEFIYQSDHNDGEG